MSVLLGVLGFIGLFFGVVNLVRPTGLVGISSRTAAGWLTVGSVVVVMIGLALTPPDDVPDQEATATTTATPDRSTTTTSMRTTTTTTPASTTTPAAHESTTSTFADVRPFAPPRDGPSGDPDQPLDAVAERATVAAVTDGDTVDVALEDGTRETVRLIGVNAPERGECWAVEATRVLEALIPPGSEIGMTADESNRDQFGRLLRYLWIGSMSVNEELVRRGAALSRLYPPDTALSVRFDAAQADAEGAQRGLWAPDACGQAVEADVRIVDLRYDAEGNDNENLNDEWIRLRNEDNRPVDMTGWGIKDESATNRFDFPGGFTIDPGESVTVYSGCGEPTPSELYWCSTGSAVWNNDGDTALLTDPAGNTHFSWAYSG